MIILEVYIQKKENILIYYNEKMKKNSAIGLDKIILINLEKI